MRLFASAANDESGPMMDNLNNVLDGIFGLFENLATMGESWGEPWDWLFPTLVALFIVLAFFAGFRFVFDISAKPTQKLFLFTLAIVALLAFVALRGDPDQNATSNGMAVLAD